MTAGRKRYEPWLHAAGIVLVLVLPFAAYPLFLAKVLCFCLFACAFNLLLGTAGLRSFGHAAFFGAGAYLSAYALKGWGLPFELALATGTASAALLGLVFAALSVRRHGLYFAMVTLALAQIVYFAVLHLPFTHADDGLTAVPRGRLLGLLDLNDIRVLYYTAATVFAAGYALIHRIWHSPFGRVLEAIRENEARAVSLGYQVERYKLLAFVLSAGLAGLAGAMKAVVVQLASPVDVHWSTSGDLILMTLLGGIGTLPGPAVGTAVVEVVELYLADSGLPVQAVVGAVFIAAILLFRRGIVGTAMRLLRS